MAGEPEIVAPGAVGGGAQAREVFGAPEEFSILVIGLEEAFDGRWVSPATVPRAQWQDKLFLCILEAPAWFRNAGPSLGEVKTFRRAKLAGGGKPKPDRDIFSVRTLPPPRPDTSARAKKKTFRAADVRPTGRPAARALGPRRRV